jgi:hypothetical protein
VAKAGSQIWLRGGTFAQTTTINLDVSGTAGNLLKIWAYNGETPVFDFTGQDRSDGLSISANYVHLKGVEVSHSGHNGIRISGGNNIVEQCRIHDNSNSGMLIRGTGAAKNLVLNCDSYFNFDSPVGGDADGFSAKWEQGDGNVFRGCRSYNNSDDGWDLWMADHSIVIDNCWAFNNGVNSWSSSSFAGNGNGFKLGGNQVATPHTVTDCLSFNNTSNGGKGFDENNNLAGQTLYNCTAFGNTNGNFVFTNTLTSGTHTFANCLSYKGKVNITSGTQKNNSWQSGPTVSDADFQSLDTTQALAPRAADGSLPAITFMHLVPGSKLIDAGIDVGFPFSGSAPDLGCFESLYAAAHAKGLLIFGGTILPFSGNSYYSTSHESVRQEVNKYIRSGAFDGFIDFDAALSDGGNPPKMKTEYATWSQTDYLHPGPAGYQKMGEAADLTLLTK